MDSYMFSDNFLAVIVFGGGFSSGISVCVFFNSMVRTMR